MASFELLLGISALCTGIYVFCKAWFFPSSMISMHKKSKERTRRVFSFFPNKFVDFLYFKDNQKITIIWSRIMALFFLILTIIFFVAVIAKQK